LIVRPSFTQRLRVLKRKLRAKFDYLRCRDLRNVWLLLTQTANNIATAHALQIFAKRGHGNYLPTA
jgi:hypothetical protein